MTLVLSLALAGVWLALACVFIGVGALVLGDRGGFEDGWRAAFGAFWIGVATVTCALLVWHLVLPVNGQTLGVVTVMGLAGCVRHRRLFVACVRTRPRWPLIFGVACAGVWVANHALDAAAIDDYLYEFQAVRWNHDFSIIPGLANLHGRLGFNESHHLLGAMLSVGPLAGNVNHVINGLFVTMMIGYLAGGLEKLMRQDDNARGSTVLRALLLGPVIGLGLFSYYGSTISTLKADILVTCCIVLLACLLVEFAESEPETTRFDRAAAVLLAASAFAMSVKLSAVAFCAALIVGVCGRLALGALRGRIRLDRLIWVGLALVAVTAVVVPLRGLLLSGYAFYPATAVSLNVDWRVPEAAANAERAIITSWAREHPTYDPRQVRGWGWLGNWTRITVLSSQFAVVLPLTLTFMCVAAAVPARARRGTLVQTPAWAFITLLVGCLAGLTVWWLEAPSSRFAPGLFWGLAATSLTWSLERQTWSAQRMVLMGMVAVTGLALSLAMIGMSPGSRGVIVLFAAAFGWMAAFSVVGQRRGDRLAVVCLALAETGDRLASFLVHARTGDAIAVLWLTPDRYMEDRSKQYVVVGRKTQSGLTVYVTGSSGFDTPIPNTRYFNPYLELRNAGSLSSGFRTRLPPDLQGYGYSMDAARPARPASDR
jgi:hypothetical protein